MSLIIDTARISAIYALLGLAWVMVFKASGILNFAVGQFLVIGVFVYYALDQAGLPLVVAFLVTLVVMSMVGAATYMGLVKRVVGLPIHAPIMLTFGLSILLDAVIGVVWGPASRNLTAPFTDVRYRFGDVASISRLEIAVVVLAATILAAIVILLKFTKVGTQMRASSESPLLASQRGVRINRLIALGWAISLIGATVGGIGFAYTSAASTSLVELGLRGLAPALVGGLDSIRGLVAGSIIVALSQTLGVYFFGGQASEVTAYVLLICVLWIKPTGLFGRKSAVRV
ncbi:branched-chain amino acid ABC transporter permease [Rhodococcoides yunnanense]|uniref:branched-chain amino acid ABC transporter permease n=1 Tax=Rhodococcoides yunnanense TaxID=278209 RepID=UPI002481D6E8|nr:branched-chain amino acid ABC transporter permease [Rhodococcus yunnanensis]